MNTNASVRQQLFDTLHDWTCFDADTGKDLAVEVREYVMPNDFSNWKNHDAFESASSKTSRQPIPKKSEFLTLRLRYKRFLANARPDAVLR